MSDQNKYYPRYAVWELTNRCNAKCIHCGSESGECRQDELTEAEALKLCGELRELGCQHLGIIGGEFFLSPHWEKVTKKLMDSGVGVSHLTNGILLNEKNLEKLKNLRVGAISVSIDGIGETHDYLRGVPGLYDRLMINLLRAKTEGFRIGINTAVSKKNLSEMPELFNQLTILEVNSWQLQGVEDFGRANKNPELSMTAEDFYRLAKMIAEFRQETKIRIVLGDNLGHFCSFEPMLRQSPFTGCVAGRWNVGIEADGSIRGCLSIRGDENIVGNVRQRSLKEIWHDPESFRVFRHKPLEKMRGFCAQCEYAQICRAGCASLAYSLTDSFYENPLCLHKYEVEQEISLAQEA